MHHHFGVYGFIKKDDKVLVIEKSRGPYLGMFDLPGGSPEKEETYEETLIRELQEEVGLTPTRFKKIFEQVQVVEFQYIKNLTAETLRHSAMLFQIQEYKGAVRQEGDGEDCLRPLWVFAEQLNLQNATPFLRMMVDAGF